MKSKSNRCKVAAGLALCSVIATGLSYAQPLPLPDNAQLQRVKNLTSNEPGPNSTDKLNIPSSAGTQNQSIPAAWSVKTEDKTLYRAMRRWSSEAGYQMVWGVDVDFPIEATVQYKGSFVDALELVMAAVKETDHPLQVLVNHHAKIIRFVRHPGFE